jgi:hypothetical protein
MTTAVILTDNSGGTPVDFTNLNITVSTRFNNPIIKIPTPKQTTDKIGENTIPINLKFLSLSYDLSFQLTDGPGTFDFETPGSTNFEKIMHLSAKSNPNCLYLNGTKFTGIIEMVNIPWKPSMKNLTTNGTLSFCTAKDISMGA